MEVQLSALMNSREVYEAGLESKDVLLYLVQKKYIAVKADGNTKILRKLPPPETLIKYAQHSNTTIIHTERYVCGRTKQITIHKYDDINDCDVRITFREPDGLEHFTQLSFQHEDWARDFANGAARLINGFKASTDQTDDLGNTYFYNRYDV